MQLHLDEAQVVVLRRNLNQTQAAALAVLCSAIRKDMTEWHGKTTVAGSAETDMQAVQEFLSDLEKLGIQSIGENDGEIVLHIGTAAKQMNPLLS